MTSMLETIQTNDDTVELSQTQLDTLVESMGRNREEIVELFGQVNGMFDGGDVTEEYFPDALSSMGGVDGAKKKKLAKRLFDMIDKDKSGKIDSYAYMLMVGLFDVVKPEKMMKCLFNLCDSDRDGFLSPPEILDVLSMFIVLRDNNDNDLDDELKTIRDKLKITVNNAFAGKTQVSEQEFYQICAETKEINGMTELGSVIGLCLKKGI